jgi:hypothetical protein
MIDGEGEANVGPNRSGGDHKLAMDDLVDAHSVCTASARFEPKINVSSSFERHGS